MLIELQVRRFRCGQRSCRQATFAEQVEALVAGVSRSTLLRLIRRLPEPETSTPRVLGVDDFALRKGHHYGTILRRAVKDERSSPR